MSVPLQAKQNFLEAALAVGLECGILAPEDVLRHLPPDTVAEGLPVESKTKLLAASIAAGTMDARLVFQTLDVRVIAENMPPHLLWACVAEAAERLLGRGVPSRPPPPQPPPMGTDSGVRRVSRNTVSRRPARLRNSTSRTSRPKPDQDFSADGDETVVRWPLADADDSSDEPVGEWSEETVPGSDDLRRR